MGRLEELRINAYLSEIARGYGNNSFIADKLFPTINSEKEKIDILIGTQMVSKGLLFKYMIRKELSEQIQM